VNRFLTIRTISKGKSLGRPPVSDEILEDLKEIVEKTLQISIACLSQQSGVPRALVTKQLHLYKISVVQESNLQIIKVVFNNVISLKITSIS
jgi:hypothetical protein